MPRVFLNTHPEGPSPTGIANYASGLRGALLALGCRVFPSEDPALQDQSARNQSVRLKRVIRDHLPGSYLLRRTLEQARFQRRIQNVSPEIYHEPTLWPLEWSGPTVMTVHDLVHLRFPETQPVSRVREIERRFAPALARSNAIIVTSSHVKEDLALRHPDIREKLFLTPVGVNRQVFFPASETTNDRLPEGLKTRRFFLCVGTLEPRKNIALAVSAHQGLPAEVRHEFPLVITGGHDWKTTLIKTDPDIILTGYLPHEVLPSLYRHARALVFPSIYEGFGLPVLEAMASGTPSILHRELASVEVAGETGTLIDDFSPEHWSSAMRAMTETPIQPAELAAMENRTRLFSWENCATATLTAYRYALEHP